MKITFEDFMQEKYGRMGTYKDSDKDIHAFDEWLQQLDVQEWLDYGAEFGDYITKDDSRVEYNGH